MFVTTLGIVLLSLAAVKPQQTTQLQLPTTQLPTTWLPTPQLPTTRLPSSTRRLTTTVIPKRTSYRPLPTTVIPKRSSYRPRTTVIAPTSTRRYYSTSSIVAPITSLGAGHVNCSADLNIDILVPSSIITKENLNIGEPLHVEGNTDCKIDYNGGLGVFNGEMSLSECFTLTENQDDIMYEAKIIGGSAPAKNGVIIRKSQFALDVICKYDRLAEIEPAKFVATRGKVSYRDEKMGEFTFTLKLYENANTSRVLSPEKEIATTENVFADVRLTDADNSGLKMGVQNCFASPSEDRKNAINTYSLIEDSCFKDDTVFTVRSSGTQYKFGFLAFQFTGDIKEIYLHCQAAVCKDDDKTGACNQPKKKCVEGARLKRSLYNATLVSPAQIFGNSSLISKRSVYEAQKQGLVAQDRMVRSIPISSDAITLEQPEKSFSVREAFGKTSWPVALLCMVALALNITLVVALVVRRIKKRQPSHYHRVPDNAF